MMGSNWRFVSVQKFTVNTVEYKPLRGNSYFELPKELSSKKAIINMKNDDDKCFMWCVARALNPVEDHPERITKELREQAEKFNCSGIEFPVAVDENIIHKFEKNNNISINIFGYSNVGGNSLSGVATGNSPYVYPLYISKHPIDYRNVNLLLISDGEKKHYCWIKNFNKLMSQRTEKSHNSMHYCLRCITGFREEDGLNRHIEDGYCSLNEALKIVMPEDGTLLIFKNCNRSMRVPVAVYFDFESFIKLIDTCRPNPADSYTNKYQKHIPSSF